MMRGNRARSPEGDRRRRYDPRDPRQPYTEGPPPPPAMPAYNQPPPPPEEARRARTPSPTFSFTSSSDSSLLDISRYKDTKQFGGIFGTFFRAPSENNRQRRRAKKKRRVLYFGNSSSSSVNSDMAYGAGYIKGTKSRSFSPRSRRASQEFRRADAPQQLPPRREREQQQPARHKRDPDAEIMNLGRQLTDLARRQKNEEENRHSGRGKALALGAAGAVGASMMASKYGRQKQDNSRGLGSSKPHRNSSDDESDWEDASDDESSSSDGSVLAYGGGNAVSQAIKPAGVAAAATATAAAATAISAYRPSTDSPSAYRDYGQKSSVVDPRLFGPYNSLRGMINTPCGFGDLAQPQYRSSAPITNERPIYPVPPPETTRFDANRTSISSRQDFPHHARPAPVPLQQPIPKAPVSSKVYNAEKFEDVTRKDSRHSRQESDDKSHWGEAAAVGLAAAAIGTAVASSSSRKEEKRERREARVEEKRDLEDRRHRDEEVYQDSKRERRETRVEEKRDLENRRYRDEEGYQASKRRERDEERQQRQQEKELRRSKRDPGPSKPADDRDSQPSKYADDRDPKGSSRFDDYDDTLRKRKDKETAVVIIPHRDPVSHIRHGEEITVDYEPETRVESRKYDARDERRELPPSTMAGQQVVTGSSQPTQPTQPTQSITSVVVDPFQYQVADDAFMTPKFTTPQRPLTPTVVTVEREPTFDDSPPRTSAVDARLSRKDSYEIEKMVEDYRQGTQDVSRYRDPREGHEYEEEQHQAMSIYDQAKRATIPVAAAAMASAIAVEEDRAREQRRGKSSEDSSRDNSRPRDAVQDEADKYYRESVIARKIASDEIRSRSTSPEPSVVDKWRDTSVETFTIVTPPDLEDKDPKKSLYDGPDADVRIDNKIFPNEENRFRISSRELDTPRFQSRDPSAERERPVLNLVYPTPVHSREPSPIPDARETTREVEETTKEVEETTREVEETTRDVAEPTSKPEVDDVIIGPKGEVMYAIPSSKSVSWGENQTKSFEVESPDGRSDSEGYVRSESSDKPRPRLNKAHRWGAIAAAMAVSSKEPVNEPEIELPSVDDQELARSLPHETRDVPVHSAQIYADDASQEPPIPGPKPTSPMTERMPGGYADDIEFTATVAAGLKDTGFDPDMVIEDPSFARRESPPGVQDANGDNWYKKPYSETVAGFAGIPVSKQAPESGFILGEVETPQESISAPTDSEREQPFDYLAGAQPSEIPGSPSDEVAARVDDVSPPRQTKREQRRRDKVVVVQDEGVSRVMDPEPVQPREEVKEMFWEDVGRQRSKKHHRSRDYDDDEVSRVSAPIGSHRGRHSPREYSSRDARSDDEWDAPKHDKRRRGSDSGDMTRFVAPVAALGALAFVGHELAKDSRSRSRSRESRRDNERDGSRKSKHRRSRDDDWDASQVSAPIDSSHRRHSSRTVPSRDARSDDEWDAPPKPKRHHKDREYYNDDGSRVSALVGTYERHSSRKSSSRDIKSDDEWETPRKSSRSKSKRDSATYDSPPRSVAPSEISIGSSSSRRSKKEKRRSGTEEDVYGYRGSPTDRRREHFDDRDVSSVVSESRGDDRHRDRGHRRSKPSRFDDDDIKSIVSAPGSGSSRRSRDHRDRKDPEKRSSGVFSSLFKSNGNKDGKRDSFLDNADTLGAGVGLAAAATVVANLNASEPLSDQEHNAFGDIRRVRSFDTFDPEVAPRAIKPAIDPQYGDLLPLPPSEPGSPYSSPGELPSLPDSRPDTPPELRAFKREVMTHQRRRSHDLPTKSPSHTAIPIQLRLANRSSPQSPIGYRSSPPAGSPVTTAADYSPSSSRRAARPTSWDSSREFKPLYLVEHSRNIPPLDEAELPELPPSEASERDSPEPESHRNSDYFGPGLEALHFADPHLQIDTNLPTMPSDEDAGSGESTPRAEFRPEFPVLAPMEAFDHQYSRELVLTDEAPWDVPQESESSRELVLADEPHMVAIQPEPSHKFVFADEQPVEVPQEPESSRELVVADELPMEAIEPESSHKLVASDDQPADTQELSTEETEPSRQPLLADEPLMEAIKSDSSRKLTLADEPSVEAQGPKASPKLVSADEVPNDVPQELLIEGPVASPELVHTAELPMAAIKPEASRELALADEPPLEVTEPMTSPKLVIADELPKDAPQESLIEGPEPSRELVTAELPQDVLQESLTKEPEPSREPVLTDELAKDVPQQSSTERPESKPVEAMTNIRSSYFRNFTPPSFRAVDNTALPTSSIETTPTRQNGPDDDDLHDDLDDLTSVDEHIPDVVGGGSEDPDPEEPLSAPREAPNTKEQFAKKVTPFNWLRNSFSRLLPDPSAEPVAKPISEPVIEEVGRVVTPEPIIKTVAEPAEPLVEATAETAKEPAGEDTARQVVLEPIAEAADEPAEPLVEAVTETVKEPVGEDIAGEVVPEANTETVADIPTVLENEPVTEELAREIIPEPTTDVIPETITEAVPKPVAEPLMEHTSELVTGPVSQFVPEVVAEASIEPPVELVSEPAEAAVEPATEPMPQAAPEPAENEYTKEAWESLAAKDRKKIKKALKKKGLELVFTDPAEPPALAEEDPNDVKAREGEESISTKEPALKDVPTELEKTEEQLSSVVEEPVEVPSTEPESLEKVVSTTVDSEEPLAEALDEAEPAEQEPDVLATDTSLDAIVEPETVGLDVQEPDTTPSEALTTDRSLDAVVEPEAVTPSPDLPITTSFDALPTEDAAAASRELSTDVVEADTTQPQSKKSKKKKKKSKAAAAVEEERVQTELAVVDPKPSLEDAAQTPINSSTQSDVLSADTYVPEVEAYAPEATPELVAERAPEPTAEPVSEAVVEPVSEPVVEPVVESTPEPAVEPAVESTPESAVEPVVESAPESAVEPAVEPVVEPVPEPAIEPVSEPVIEAVEPVVESVSEPVVEPVVEPAPESAVEPVVESTPEPAVETTVDPTVEPAVEPVVESTPESAVEPVVEPVVESVVEPVLEPALEPVSEPVIEAVEPVVEPVAEHAPEPTAEPVEEPLPEPVVEPILVETSESPSKSKKKKKKKKGAQSEDPAPPETLETSMPSEEPLPIMSEEVEQSGDTDGTKDMPESVTESLPVDGPSPEVLATEPEPEIAIDQETAEPPKGKKKKKRKSVHWEPEETSTPLAAAQEDTTPTPPSEGNDQSVDADDTPSVLEGSQELEKDATLATEALEPDTKKSFDEQPGADLSDDALSAWDIGTETPENIEELDQAASKTDVLPEADDVLTVNEPPPTLESYVSEPLFSQNDAPVEDSQATSIDLESTQPEESSLVLDDVTRDIPTSDEPASAIEDVETQALESPATETTEPTDGTSKKKAKKNKKKKKNQAAQEEVTEEPKAEEPSPGPAESAEEPSETPAEEPKPEEISVQPIEPVEESSVDKPLEAPIFETPQETPDLGEIPPTDEIQVGDTPVDPAQVTEDSGVDKPSDGPVVDDSTEVTRDAEISEVQEVPADEESAPMSGKKSKKKKKKTKSVSLTEPDTLQDSPLENSAQSSLTQEPLTQEPAKEEPLTQEHVTEELLTQEPITEEAIKQASLAQEPVTEEPRTQEPITEELPTQELATEELPTQEPITEELVKDDSPVQEPVTDEPRTQEPITEELPTQELATEDFPTQEPITEELLTEASLTQEPKLLDEIAVATEAELPVQEEVVVSPPVEENPENPPPAESESLAEIAPVEPEAEPETPKKGKKNKKKKKKNSLSLDDGEKLPEGQPVSQEPSDSAPREIDLNGTTDLAKDEASPNGLDVLDKGSEEPIEALPPTDESTTPLDPEKIPEIAPENDEQTKPADVQTLLETPPVQDPVDAPAADAPDASASEQPPAEPPVPSAEDPESLPTKKSKKEKKKKKKKAALEETTEPESGVATPSEETSAGPATEAADSVVDKAAHPSEDTPPETETTETPAAEPVPEAETTAPADVSTLVESNETGEPPASSLEPDANPEDERGGFSPKMSNTDKKIKKAKDNDSQILQDPKTNPLPQPEPELEKDANAAADADAGNLGLSEKDKEEKGKEPVIDLETPVESEAKPEETEKQENDDEYAGLSKKQKKKMMRAKALAALESSVEPETPKEPEATSEVPTESVAEPNTEPESKPEPETEPAAESTAEPDIDSGSKLENETTSTVGLEPETVPIVEPETEAESKPETETQHLVDPETQSSVVEPLVAEPAADPNLETESKLAHENELVDRSVSDALEPELVAGEKPNVEAESTEPTAEPEIETEPKSDPKTLPTPAETPGEPIETTTSAQSIVATEETVTVEFEIEPVEQNVDEVALALPKNDKKKKKKKSKGQDAETESPQDIQAPKEADSAGPVDEIPVEPSTEAVVEPTQEPAESAQEAAELGLEPSELKAVAIGPAAGRDTELDTKPEVEAQDTPKELSEQTHPPPDVANVPEAEIEVSPTPEVAAEAEPNSTRKDDDNTNGGLTKKEKRKKKKKGKGVDLEASQELEQPKPADISPESAPTDTAQLEATLVPEATTDVFEPSPRTVDIHETNPEVAAETKTDTMTVPAPDAMVAPGPTSEVFVPEPEGQIAEENDPELTRGLEPEPAMSTEPCSEGADELNLIGTLEDVIAEPEPESEKKEEVVDNLTLSKKDKKKKKKKKSKGSAADSLDEPERPLEPEDSVALETSLSELAIPTKSNEPAEPVQVPDAESAEAGEVVEPLESVEQVKTAEIVESVNISEPARPVDVVEPTIETALEAERQLEPEPEQAQEDEPKESTSTKSKKKKKKNKASSSASLEGAELVNEPEAALDLAPEPAPKPAPENAPDSSLEPVLDPAPEPAALHSKPPPEEPQQDDEPGSSLSRSIYPDQEKSPGAFEESEVPTEPASDSLNNLEPVVPEAQPEPEAEATPKATTVPQDLVDPYAGLSKKEIKRMKKAAKAAAVNTVETPEPTKDTAPNEFTSGPLEDTKVDTAEPETTSTQGAEPAVETELAPELTNTPEGELIREAELDVVSEVQSETTPVVESSLYAEAIPEAGSTPEAEPENAEKTETRPEPVPGIVPTPEVDREILPEPERKEEDEQNAPLSKKEKKKKKKKGKSVAFDLEEPSQPTEEATLPFDLDRAAELAVSEEPKTESESQPELITKEEGDSASLGPSEENREDKVEDVDLVETPEAVTLATEGSQHDEPEQALEVPPLVAERSALTESEPHVKAQLEVEQKDDVHAQRTGTSKQDMMKKKKTKAKSKEMELEEQAHQPSSTLDSVAELLGEELLISQTESPTEPSMAHEAEVTVTKPPVEPEAESQPEPQAEAQPDSQLEFDVEPTAENEPGSRNVLHIPREAEATTLNSRLELEPRSEKQEGELPGPRLSKKDKKKKKKKGKATEGEPAEPAFEPESAVESIQLSEIPNEPEHAHESNEVPQGLDAIPEQSETITEPEADVHLEPAEPVKEAVAEIELFESARELEPATALAETATKLESVAEPNAYPELATAPEAAVEPRTLAETTSTNDFEADRPLDTEPPKELGEFGEPAHESTRAEEPEASKEPNVETAADPAKTEEDDLRGATTSKKAKKKKQQQKAKLAAQVEESGELTAQFASTSTPMQLDVEEAVSQNPPEAGHPGLGNDHDLNDPHQLGQVQTDKHLNELQDMKSVTQIEASNLPLPTYAPEDTREQPFDSETPLDASMIQPEVPSLDAWPDSSVGKRTKKDKKKKNKKGNADALPDDEPSSSVVMSGGIQMTEPVPLTEEAPAENIQLLPEASVGFNESISIFDGREQPREHTPSRELETPEIADRPSPMEEAPRALETKPTIEEAIELIPQQPEAAAKEIDMGELAAPDVVTHQETPTEELQDKDLQTKTSKDKKKEKKGNPVQDILEPTTELVPEARPAPDVEPMEVDVSTPADDPLEVPVEQVLLVEATPVDVSSVGISPVEDIPAQEAAVPDSPVDEDLPRGAPSGDIAMQDPQVEVALPKEPTASDPPAEDASAPIPILDETIQEPDSEIPTKKSKKDKKNAKKLARSLAAAESSPADESIIEKQQETPVQQAMDEPLPISANDKDDDEWTLPVKKIGIRSKPDSAPMSVPDVEMDLPAFNEPSATFTESQRIIESEAGLEPSPPLELTRSIDTEAPQSIEPSGSREKDDEEWALPLKRKGKEAKPKPMDVDIAMKGAEEPAIPSLTQISRGISLEKEEASVPVRGDETRDPVIVLERSHRTEVADDKPKDSPTSKTKKKKERKLSSTQTQQPTPEVTPEPDTQTIEKSLVMEDAAAISVDNARDLSGGAISRDVSERADDRVHETPYEDLPSLQRQAPDPRDFRLEEPTKHGKKKKEFKPIDHVQGSGLLDDDMDFVDDWVAPSPSLKASQSKTSARAPKVDHESLPVTPPRDYKAAGRAKSTPHGKEETTSAIEIVAAAAAAATGATVLVDKLGSKTKGNVGKFTDRGVQDEDEMFNDQGLEEDVHVRKTAAVGQSSFHERKKPRVKMDEAFWGSSDKPKETIKGTERDFEDQGRDKANTTITAKESSRTKGKSKSKDHEPVVVRDSFTGRKETSRQNEWLDHDDMAESPVLGRGNTDLPRPPLQGLLRRGSDMEEPVGGLLREDSRTPTSFGELGSEVGELRRSPSRLLEPVPEVPEAEAEPTKRRLKQLDANRDSGYAGDSPHPQRRSKALNEEQQRDSGVHSGDWSDAASRERANRERASRERAGLQTPEPASERRLRRSPRGTPVLREPPAQSATPEPEKKKQYGGLVAAGVAGIAVSAAAAGLAARSATSTPSRSVSDNPPLSRQSSPRPEAFARRSLSNTSLSRRRTPEPLKLRPESPGIQRSSGTPTPPLRRVDKRMSGDLRTLRTQNNTTPVANEGRVRAKDMADVYDGFGEGRIGSPRSPTRPHSMRRRQSMQVLELENKVEQLLAENRALSDARATAETSVSQRAVTTLADRDAEIDALRQSLKFLQNEVSRLTEVNDGLASANAELANKDKRRYTDLEVRHATIIRELDDARGAQGQLDQTLQEKDDEIAKLREQLETAKEKIREMQRQILETKASDEHFLNLRDEDHFDHRCQQLCSHVQQWVLRFSKFSDMRACRLTSEINDEKTIDRLDNAVLDGSDVDTYLKDRVKRRDIFMSMTMNMIWEFVFTRYLFGMDREQRQKLKSLEKLLTEVGPPEAVRQWRAVTLTLLAKRDSFKRQRDLDTEAVVQAVFQTLCKILPPPGNLEDQIQSQLRRVMKEAVGLSVEMRTQKAEYMMLPPLQPEYDADGELAATVQFNASMMNERSGSANMTNEDLEAQGAVVRVVLFPLVVKKGDDTGKGDEEIVVCPAQVLIARSKLHFGGSSDVGGTSLGARSHISVVTEHMAQPEAEYLEGGI